MALSNFIPEVWASSLLKALQKSIVAAQDSVINRDYEGDVKGHGDTVRINSFGKITVSDYSKDTDIAAPQALSSSSQSLVLDQAKYFNLSIDSIDQAQMTPKIMTEAVSYAAYSVSDVMDQFILGLYTGVSGTVGASGEGDATAITPTTSNVYEALVNASTMLNETNTPRDGRFVIVPPFVEGWLLKDQRYVSFGTAANRDNLTNGSIGRAAGFDVLISNNVSNSSGTDYKCIAGHKVGWSFVDALTEISAYSPQLRFGDAVKGLFVYGAKVVRPETLCVVHCNKS